MLYLHPVLVTPTIDHWRGCLIALLHCIPNGRAVTVNCGNGKRKLLGVGGCLCCSSCCHLLSHDPPAPQTLTPYIWIYSTQTAPSGGQNFFPFSTSPFQAPLFARALGIPVPFLPCYHAPARGYTEYWSVLSWIHLWLILSFLRQFSVNTSATSPLTDWASCSYSKYSQFFMFSNGTLGVERERRREKKHIATFFLIPLAESCSSVQAVCESTGRSDSSGGWSGIRGRQWNMKSGRIKDGDDPEKNIAVQAQTQGKTKIRW